MVIAVASGKGGTGKTTVAVNLAVAASRSGRSVHLCDCDVEEPNAHLFLDFQADITSIVTEPVPEIDHDACVHCGRCGEICEFNAIACLPGKTMVLTELCHGCGGCWLVCPEKAVRRKEKVLGEVASGTAGELAFTSGRMRVGEVLAPAVIRAVKKMPSSRSWVILDSPPGTTCPVVETLREADFVVLVTEPTPFGIHDLELALTLVRRMDLPCGVVVNRDTEQGDPVGEFCSREGVEVLARLPFSRKIAGVCAEGGLALDADPDVSAALTSLATRLADREIRT